MDIIPEPDPLPNKFTGVSEAQQHPTLRRRHQALSELMLFLAKKLVSRHQNGVEHGLIDARIAHPLGYNDINVRNAIRKFSQVLYFASNDAGVGRVSLK